MRMATSTGRCYLLLVLYTLFENLKNNSDKHMTRESEKENAPNINTVAILILDH